MSSTLDILLTIQYFLLTGIVMQYETVCTIKKLTKRYQDIPALEGLTMELKHNELLSVIGPSGAGKTTLLRLVAGLEKPDEGEIRFAVPPDRNNPVVLVFQDFMLFPGMSVARNVGFGLRARGVKASDVEKEVSRLLEVFGITDKAHSYPRLLSAGQQQRVALARALAVRPAVLLLDEPFAHLDKSLRMETARYLRSVQQEFRITMVAVTHDLEEAFSMSDRVGILIDGKMIQLGAVEEVYTRPASFEAASFLGPVNRFPAGLLGVMEKSGETERAFPSSQEMPEEIYFCRAESMSLSPDPQGPGIVKEIRFIGILVLYLVYLEHNGYKADLSIFSLENGLKVGDRVRIGVSNIFREREHI
jgi:putative spermidine/putrescine transport system ATP-binding protein